MCIRDSVYNVGTSIISWTVTDGCSNSSTCQTSITVTAQPTAAISYAGSPFCSGQTSTSVTLTGTGAYTGGIFSAPAGLSINTSTGAVDFTASSPGTYTVTYTIPASG